MQFIYNDAKSLSQNFERKYMDLKLKGFLKWRDSKYFKVLLENDGKNLNKRNVRIL